MRILHLNEHLDYRGGIETYLLGLIPRLEADGVETVAGYADGDGTLAPRTVRIPAMATAPMRRDAAGRQAMRRVLQSEQPDVIHLHNIQNADIIEECLEASAVVFTAHDYRYLCPASTFFHRRSTTICERTCGPACFGVTLRRRCLTPRPRQAWAYYRRVQRVLQNVRRFSAVIAPSQSAADRLHAAGFAGAQVHVLPYFCPIEVRTSPRPLPSQPNLLYVGRLSANKGWEFYVRALGLMSAEVRGTMVGNFNDDSIAAVQRLADDCGCRHRLTLRPWAGRDEIRQVMESASLLVFPSTWAETLGIVGLEALATGVPVIASDVGGVREWLLPGRTGLLTPPKDAEAIANAATQLLSDPAQMLRMGTAGQLLIQERFTPQRHVERLVDIYRTAVSQTADQRLASRIVPAVSM